MCDKKFNKIIVKCSVFFYSKAWIRRNEIMRDTGKCREHAIEWCKRIAAEIESGNKPSMLQWVRMQKIDEKNVTQGT